jgi:hypothetical protein
MCVCVLVVVFLSYFLLIEKCAGCCVSFLFKEKTFKFFIFHCNPIPDKTADILTFSVVFDLLLEGINPAA